MDKIKLETKLPENVTIDYNKIKIEITPFLTMVQQVFLIQKYIEDYFSKPGEIIIQNTRYHHLEAEVNLKYYILQLITNVDINSIDNNIYADSILWDKIEDEIQNYWDFKMRLKEIVDGIKEQESLDNSIGKIISDLVEKANSFLDKISDIDAEKIKEAGEKGLELIHELEKTSVLRNPYDKAAIMEPKTEKIPEELPIPKEITIKKKRTRVKKI